MHSSHHWIQARVSATRVLTPTVKEITFVTDSTARPSPGSHLQLQVPVNGVAQIRSYSLIAHLADALQPGTFKIAVKRLDSGLGGSKAMWALSEGQTLQVSSPQNHFPLVLGAPAYLLIAGGIGITPLISMARVLAKSQAKLRLLYGARSADEFAYAAELGRCLGEQLVLFDQSAGQLIDFTHEFNQLPAGALAYTCGPAPMLNALRAAWQSTGRPASQLRFETFGSSGQMPSQAFEVRIARLGVALSVPANTSLLTALEQAGVQTLYDCKRGECGLCAMDVLAIDGSIDHRDVFFSEHEKASNTRMCVCVSRATGTLTLDCAYRAEPAQKSGSSTEARDFAAQELTPSSLEAR